MKHTYRIIFLMVCLLSMASCVPAGTWLERGPRASGRVSAIAATDLNHLWAASPGGGVWKSTDGGSNWEWSGNYGLGDFTALDLALDRNDSSRMFLRTWNGFWVSTDGGANWTRTLYSQRDGGDTSNIQPFFVCGPSFPCPPAHAPDFEPRPFAQMVFLLSQSVLLTALPCGGLQYSTNSGANFTQLWPFPGSRPETNPDNCITSVAADEATGKVYFASMSTPIGDRTHIWRSTSPWTASGPPPVLSWQLVSNGLPLNRAADALAWGGSADRLMALVTDWNAPPNNSSAYLFNGTTWTPKPFNNAACYMPDARSLVWGSGNDFFVGGVTFGYTTDAGNTWVCPSLDTQYVDIRAIRANGTLGRVWIGGDQSALEANFVISSYPWTPGVGLGAPTGIRGHGMSTWQAYSAGIAPPSAGRNWIIVGAQDIGDACSDDGGVSWRVLGTDEAQSIAWPRSGSGNLLYSYSTKGTLQRSNNISTAANCSAVTITDVSPPDSLRELKALAGPHSMAVHPTDLNRVFLAGFRDIIYTTSGGSSWTKSTFSPAGFGSPPPPAALFVDEDGVLYVGTQDGGAFTCTDTVHICDSSPGSGAWTPWGLNPGPGVTPPRMISAITESNPPPSPRTFWMATSSGLYRKLAGAGAWTLVDSAISGYVFNEVAVDSSCPTRVYTGIGYLDVMSRSRGGIDVSSDNGASWASLTSGFALHNVPITQIVIDPGNPQPVLATTYGRGLWEYNWGSALPACHP